LSVFEPAEVTQDFYKQPALIDQIITVSDSIITGNLIEKLTGNPIE